MKKISQLFFRKLMEVNNNTNLPGNNKNLRFHLPNVVFSNKNKEQNNNNSNFLTRVKSQADRKQNQSPFFKDLNLKKNKMKATFHNTMSKLQTSMTRAGLSSSRINQTINNCIKKERNTQKNMVKAPIVQLSTAPKLKSVYFSCSEIINQRSPQNIFYFYRTGTALASNNNNLYLYGGNPLTNKYEKPPLHVFDSDYAQWHVEKHQGPAPDQSPCFHTAQIYKNLLLFIGGVISVPKQSNKIFCNDISTFDLQTKHWKRFLWNVKIKNHASVLYDNNLVVFGGIHENQTYSNELHFVAINRNNIENSLHFRFKTSDQPIAYHQMAHTFDVASSIKLHLSKKGIIMFGGILEDRSMTNQVKMLDAKNLQTKQKYYLKNWEVVSNIKGKVPMPRYQHSMNILSQTGLLIIIGGKNINQEILKDIWILNLVHLAWVDVSIKENDPYFIKNNLHSHKTAVLNDQIYIFGGITNQSQINTSLIKLNLMPSIQMPSLFAYIINKAKRNNNFSKSNRKPPSKKTQKSIFI